MSLSHGLLEQAQHLARRERGKPKQVSLRRAISAAYYAVFHLLLEEMAAQSVPAAVAPMRSVATRAVNHSDVRKVCTWFASGGNLPGGLTLSAPTSADLRLVADTFVRLMQNRHAADYDLAARFKRSDTVVLVELAEQAFAAWGRIRATEEGKAFLLFLLITDRWRR